MQKKGRKLGKSLGMIAYEAISEKIITLQYKPGQNLEEQMLMQELKLGRTPIREAIMRLVGEKLIESTPGKGAVVRPINLADVKAIFEMMRILEIGVANLALQHYPDIHLGNMIKANEDVKSAIRADDMLALVKANHEFHIEYARCARNDYLFNGLVNIRNEAKRLSYLSYASEKAVARSRREHYDAVLEEHGRMIACLKEGDLEGLMQTIQVHIDAFQKRIVSYMMES